jgi:hypothetical protein
MPVMHQSLKQFAIIGSSLAIALANVGCDAKKEAAPQASAPSAPTSAAAVPAASAAMDTVASLENANDPKKLFADPSLTKFPSKDFVFVYGNGQTLSIEYDGSKSKPGDPVFFDLTMINPEGIVVQVGSDTFDGRTPDRVFSKSNKMFRSEVDGRSGFVEINIAQNVGLDANGKISGKNLMIGRFPIKFEASK